MAELYPPDPVDYDDQQSQDEAFKSYEMLDFIAPYSWQHMIVCAVQLAAEDYEEQEHLEKRAAELMKKHKLTPFYSLLPEELEKVIYNLDELEKAYAEGEAFSALLAMYIIEEITQLVFDDVFSGQPDKAVFQDNKDLPIKERFLRALNHKRNWYS